MEYPSNRGGVGRYLESIVSVWPKDDIQVEIATLFNFGWPRWLKSLAIPYRINPKAIWISHILPLGYVALVYKLLTGTPYTIFVHGTDVQFAAKSAWKRFWAKIILKNAEQIIANSKYTLSLVERLKIANRKLKIIYPCPTFNTASTMGNKTPFTILSVGRLVPRKGFDHGIEAAIELKKEFPNLTYTIIGNGAEEEKLKNLILENNAEAYIQILTDADDISLQDYYAKSELLLAPGREIDGDVEGFGLVIVEAAQFGTPSVATNIGGVGEAIIDGQTGILIQDNNVETIVSAIAKLLKNNESRRQMGQAAKRRVEQDFNMKNQIQKLI